MTNKPDVHEDEHERNGVAVINGKVVDFHEYGRRQPPDPQMDEAMARLRERPIVWPVGMVPIQD